ncbi:MAG: hypothetical protein OEW68_11130 [Gammaproteobacteria bacterium]|nr:hypothetical protein [Gammaproteobacteria bacterium]MDH4315384.1 hypothetical protein [Gammaproteobacteria bacterium]MDH5214089.1 hypothetical protein [Gammaproteobacteria bacterium]MDH5500057.1 hypothetical protein [Gammaproteobacteria bacterium]
MKIDRSTVIALTILAAILIAAILVYLPGLAGPLLLDDLPQLGPLIEQGAIDPVTLFWNYIVSTSGPLGRPVSMATFIADAVTHGPDTWWWKYDNLMFHLVCGLLLCWLTALLLHASLPRNPVNSWIVAAVVAGLWLLHPLQVSTVLYTVQRMTVLSTLFVLAGLVCYTKGRMLQERSAIRGWLLIGAGFLLFWPLGVLSKESALVFPIYCSLIEFTVFGLRGTASLYRQIRAFHAVLVAGYVSIAAFVLWNFSSVVLEAYAVRDFTLAERVFTQCRIIVVYLSQILLPIQRKMGFFHDDIVLSTGLIEPVTTLLSALLLLALLASGILLRRKLPLYAFGILFFFASHAMESSIFGLELMFEHRNYIGSAGILIALVSMALLAKNYGRALVAGAVIGLIGFSLLTWQRSVTWSTPDYMYIYMYEVHQQSPRLNLMFANAHAAAKDFPRARRSLAKVGPGLGSELHGLFFDCLDQGTIDETAITGVARLENGIIDGHTTSSADALVREVTSGRCFASKQALVSLLDRVLTARPRTPADTKFIHFTRAQLAESMGDIDSTVDAYLAAQALARNDALPSYLAAGALVRLNQPDSALAMLKDADELDKGNRIQRDQIAQQVYSELGNLYEQRGEYGEALTVYADGIASMPRRSLAYLQMAALLLRLQQYDEVKNMIDGISKTELTDLDEHRHLLLMISSALERQRPESPRTEQDY